MKILPSPVLSKHSHGRCKHSFWGQVCTSCRYTPLNSCQWDFKYRKSTEKDAHFLLKIKKTPLMPPTDSVITKPAAHKMKTAPVLVMTMKIFGNKAEKLFIFQEMWGGNARGGRFVWSDSQLVLSLRPPEEWTDYHRLSGRKPSCWDQSTDPPRFGLWMQIKLFLFIKRLAERKPIPKAAVWRRRTVKT